MFIPRNSLKELSSAATAAAALHLKLLYTNIWVSARVGRTSHTQIKQHRFFFNHILRDGRQLHGRKLLLFLLLLLGFQNIYMYWCLKDTMCTGVRSVNEAASLLEISRCHGSGSSNSNSIRSFQETPYMYVDCRCRDAVHCTDEMLIELNCSHIFCWR